MAGQSVRLGQLPRLHPRLNSLSPRVITNFRWTHNCANKMRNCPHVNRHQSLGSLVFCLVGKRDDWPLNDRNKAVAMIELKESAKDEITR